MPQKNPAPLKLPRRYRIYQGLYLVILAIFSFLGWSRMALVFDERALLTQIGVRPDPLLLAVGGALWGLLGLAGIGLLFVKRKWARALEVGISLVFALTYWLDRLLLSQSPGSLANWPFALLITLVLLAFSASLMVVLESWDQVLGAGAARKADQA